MDGARIARLKKDLADLNPDSPAYKVQFPNPEDLDNFVVTISPLAGLYSGGHYKFTFVIGDDFPFKWPGIHVATKVWHPQFGELPHDGISMRAYPRVDPEDPDKVVMKTWQPMVTILDFINNLQELFQEVHPDDPENLEAAEQFQNDYEAFKSKVEQYRDAYAKE
jgi:ubiquitin-conjugating enzyme E2 M